MSLSRGDKIVLGKIKERKISIDFIYEHHTVTETYDGLFKGTRRFEVQAFTRLHNPSFSMTYKPRKANNFRGSFKTLFQKHPYATLHTPKFSILINV